MNDFVREYEDRYQVPSYAEIDRLIAEANRMRSAVLRDALTGLWAMLRRRAPAKAESYGVRTA